MRLQLKPTHRHPPARTAAALLEGPDPAAWLLEISRWGVPLERLRCFVLPRSVHTVEPGGLLVVFQQAADAHRAEPKSPYQVLGSKLYIPADAEIFPTVGESEWPQLLVWDVQVLHPYIGLVGFHATDALDFSTLLDFGSSRPADWGLAQSGISPRPPFRQIEVRQPKPDDLIQSFRKDEGTKPLSDLSPKSQPNPPTDDLRRYLLERTLKAAEGYRNAFGDPARPYDGKDWLARIEQWVQRQLDSIMAKRNSEIDRLLDLFDRDTDEALRYALPLDDPYAKRGNAPPSSTLGPRSTDFNLGHIGGGGAADAWSLNNKQIYDLRQKYHAAAQKAIAAGDYRQAAYIYAHLLHEYGTAANVLTQGGYWREAAALHKDHLNNLPAAAECLEKGKLYWEAIEIYEKLGRHEKVGDLYRIIGDEEKAAAAWEKHIENALQNDDHMEAARVLLQKKHDTDRAKALLLEAWTKPSKQAEPCLLRYFQVVAETEPEHLSARLQEVAQHHTLLPQRPQLLNALIHLAERHTDNDTLSTTRHIAYGIISEQVRQGHRDKVLLLQRFLPGDPLVAGDSSRFVDHKTPPKAPPHISTAITQLDPTVQWRQAIVHRNQILAFGAKNNQLQLARANWRGATEYYVWDTTLPVQWPLTVYHFPSTNNYVFLHDAEGNGFPEKTLPASQQFDGALVVGWPTWLPTNPMALGMAASPETVLAAAESNSLICLYRYHRGKLEESKTPLGGDHDDIGMSDLRGVRLPMVRVGGSSFIANNNWLLKLKENLEPEFITVGERNILKMLPMQGPNSLRIVLVTTGGCVVLDPFQAKTELRDVDFFGTEEGCADAQLIGQDHLVMVFQEAIEVYDINRMSCSGRLSRRISSSGSLKWAAVLPTANRERFAVLDQGGKLKEFDLK